MVIEQLERPVVETINSQTPLRGPIPGTKEAIVLDALSSGFSRPEIANSSEDSILNVQHTVARLRRKGHLPPATREESIRASRESRKKYISSICGNRALCSISYVCRRDPRGFAV